MLAYSRSCDEVDELRRLSILGRAGAGAVPGDAARMGRLPAASRRRGRRADRRAARAGHPAPHRGRHPRRRPAARHRSGCRRARSRSPSSAEQALLGAARITRRRSWSAPATPPSPELRLREDLLAGLLDGRWHPRRRRRRDRRRPGAARPQVLAFAARHRAARPGRLRRAELVAHHRRARRRVPARRAGRAAGRPGLRAAAGRAPGTGRRGRGAGPGDRRPRPAGTWTSARAALGAVVPRLSDAAASRGDADRVLADDGARALAGRRRVAGRRARRGAAVGGARPTSATSRGSATRG